VSEPVRERIVGRFAPSPTGALHLGSLVAALGSYLFARQGNGLWLVRMEDLDLPRVVPGMGDDILSTLETLGFEWDGEVVCQSLRNDLYEEALKRLLATGHAYPCGCTRSEIAAIASAPHGEEPVYPGTCRNGLPQGKSARAWRVRVAEEPLRFTDLVMGDCTISLATACGDFVVKRADGLFAYQLAVVVDDFEQRVNQVVRGADLLDSTPRQIHLQRLLGYATPAYAHLPLVVNMDGSKLSKRDNALSIASGRDLVKERGGLIAAALRFLGQEIPHELVGADAPELLQWGVANFAPSRIPRVPAPFLL
jgi:glutamyl-Q tRNA(Asp) synthetase